jgi:tetratricopeptide (TPR) repeat protein
MIDCAPENYVAYGNLGGAYLSFERDSDARQMFERSLEIKPNYGAYANLGWIAFSESNFGEAAQMYRRALEIDDTDYVVWGNLGHSYHWMQQADTARPHYERAIEVGEARLQATPNDLLLLTDLASYHGMLGNREQGLRHLARAVELEDGTPEAMAHIGEAFEDCGEREKALEWIERALDSGLPPSWIGNSPTLREDECFRQLAEGGEVAE